jgi:hypothetical protein
MADDSKFRPINPLLGARPSFGPIPADLLLPWGAIGLLIFMTTRNVFPAFGLVLGWEWTIGLVVWGCATWWVLTGSRPYRFLSKFLPVPNRWSRGHVRYRPLQRHDDDA